MLKRGHQLFSIVSIYWLAEVGQRYYSDISIVNAYSDMIYTLPLIAIPYILIFSILPDWDWNWKINHAYFTDPSSWTKIYPLEVFFKIMRLFTKHRWFTHRIEWIATVFIWLLALSFLKFDLAWLIIFNLISIWFLFSILDNKIIKYLMSGIIVIFSPLLMNPEHYYFFLIACALWYTSHMLWDAITHERWTIFKFFKFEIKIPYPKFLTFRAGGSFELKVLYPIFWLTIFYLIYLKYEFLLNKIFVEFISVLWIWKSILFLG